MSKLPLTIDDIFSLCEMDPNGGCWLFPGASPGHYPTKWINGKRVALHRAALEMTIGRDLGRGEFACHRCNIRACANPAHLYAGTQLENMADALRAGTLQAREIKPRRENVTVEDVKRIFADARSDEAIATVFGVPTKYVQDIKRGKVWRGATSSLGQPRPANRGGRPRGTGGKPKRDIRHDRLRRNKVLTS